MTLVELGFCSRSKRTRGGLVLFYHVDSGNAGRNTPAPSSPVAAGRGGGCGARSVLSKSEGRARPMQRVLDIEGLGACRAVQFSRPSKLPLRAQILGRRSSKLLRSGPGTCAWSASAAVEHARSYGHHLRSSKLPDGCRPLFGASGIQAFHTVGASNSTGCASGFPVMEVF